MKSLIVPTDFSKESKNAIELSIILANHFEANIQLIYVVHDKEKIFGESDAVTSEMIDQLFAQIIEENKWKLNSTSQMEYVVKQGKIYKEIINYANSFDDSLIVCSTHGESGFEKMFIGGNAYRIVSSSEKPVITIQGNKIPETIKKIVLPIDIVPETREKVPFTAMLAKNFNAVVYIVTVSSSDNEKVKEKLHQYTSQVVNYLNKYQINYEIAEIEGKNITDITIEYANSVHADLISIMSEQEVSLRNILLGNYAHQMINDSLIPVLIYPTSLIGTPIENLRTQGIDY